ncbi:hypothetical protein BDF19DRAFT_412316 [Syncephalis fuscata]|nr:hypothetical protein BDF19DRAFT_412316 [Syncephalis fuscata]
MTPQSASSTFTSIFTGRRRSHSFNSQPSTPDTIALPTPKSFRHSSYFPTTSSTYQSDSPPPWHSSSNSPRVSIDLPSDNTTKETTKNAKEIVKDQPLDTDTNATITLEKFPSLEKNTNNNNNTLTSDQRSMKKRFPELDDEVHLLIDSYACVLQRDLPWHGRLYICPGMACFYGVLFGRRIREVFPLGEVKTIDKELRFKLFPSAIRISMHNGQECTLRSFIKRDAAWKVLTTACQAYQQPSTLPTPLPRKHRRSITSILTRSSDDSAVNRGMEAMITPQIQKNDRKDQSDAITHSSDNKSLDRSQSDVQPISADNSEHLTQRRSQSLKRDNRTVNKTQHQHSVTLDLSSESSRSKRCAYTKSAIIKSLTIKEPSPTIHPATAPTSPAALSPPPNFASDTTSINEVNDNHLCGCTNHGKYKLLDTQLAIKPNVAFRALFGEDGHAIRPSDRDQRWNRDSNGHWTERDLAYTSFFRPLSAYKILIMVAIIVPKKLPVTYEHQRIRACEHQQGVYMVDTWTRFTAITAADRLVVYVRWCLTGTAPNEQGIFTSTRVVATSFVEFTRKVLIREGKAL